jgi:hypothetical protein
MTCGAKYAIPDARVARAGDSGLRVRCTRCRSIMAVPAASAAATPAAAERATSSFGGSGVGSADGTDASRVALATGVWKDPFAAVAAPATIGASGELQGAAGVTREVTGVMAGLLANLAPPASPVSTASQPSPARPRVWFCAIDGRARGPYSADEMLALAHKGKVRTSTLVWRPGASGWKPLRSVDAFDVAWLLDAARQRRDAEQRAEQDMLRRRGIVPVRLERRTVRAATARDVAGPVATPTATTIGTPIGTPTATPIGTPTATPIGAEAVFDDDAGPGALPVVRALHELDDGGGAPFVWRAPQTPRGVSTGRSLQQRRGRPVARALIGVLAVCGLVVVGLVVAGGVHVADVIDAARTMAGVQPAP